MLECESRAILGTNDTCIWRTLSEVRAYSQIRLRNSAGSSRRCGDVILDAEVEIVG